MGVVVVAVAVVVVDGMFVCFLLLLLLLLLLFSLLIDAAFWSQRVSCMISCDNTKNEIKQESTFTVDMGSSPGFWTQSNGETDPGRRFACVSLPAGSLEVVAGFVNLPKGVFLGVLEWFRCYCMFVSGSNSK